MNKYLLVVIIAFLIFSCSEEEKSVNSSVDGSSLMTEEAKAALKDIDSLMIKINSKPLDIPDSDLGFLDELADIRVLSLGEATHGTKEFFEMKHRIFKYMVEKHGHKAFVIEADMGESVFLDNYIKSGEGDLRNLMIKKMHFWTWRTEEVRELIEWMREYNSGKSDDDKIHYFGYDCQFTTYQPSLIKGYLQGTSNDLHLLATSRLSEIESFGGKYEGMMSTKFNKIRDSLNSLVKLFDNNKSILIENSSEWDFNKYRQLAVNLGQSHEELYYYETGNTTKNWRDFYMAANIKWISDLMGPGSKITSWAHNGHAAVDGNYGGNGSMGWELNTMFGSSHKVIGFSFSKGRFTAIGIDSRGHYKGVVSNLISRSPKFGSLNYLFYKSSHPDFIINMDGLDYHSNLSKWLANPRMFMMIGSVFNNNPDNYYRSIIVPVHYNYMINFDSTKASEYFNE